MAPPQPGALHIGISLGNMGSLQDGLGEFALQMGQHIAGLAVPWREQYGVHFHFHARTHLHGAFGDQVGYLPVTRAQRYWHRQPLRFALWHSVHQLNKTLPPAGCGPRLVTVHDLNYIYKPNALSRWRDHHRALALARRSDHLVAISEYSATDVRRHWHWTGPLEVIYRGPRDLTGVTPVAPEGFETRGRPFLFHLSRMSRSKNPQAIIGLAASWPEMDFLFCGPPTDEARALKAATTLPNVHFRFAISDAQKAWAFRQCAGFVFPSFTEGFGLPPIEAMQFGKPVFLSRLTSLPEVGGDAAWYFDDWDPAAMRSVVEQGLQAGAQPSRIEAVRRHAARFDWEQAADQYMALYLRLAGLGQAAR
jgi:glycosyltransferase involved in cell wall biosynthesis